MSTVPAQHTVRSASGSFFFRVMANKNPLLIADQILLLKQRGLLFKNQDTAHHFLENISYYRLKGYWWDLQQDLKKHTFKSNTYFEHIIERYKFDRQLRLILFDAIELIEIAIRTKMIYHLSMAYGSLWYLNSELFASKAIPANPVVTYYQNTVNELNKEFFRSQETFIKDQRKRHPDHNPDAWKILEVASMGTLSKLYKNLKHQLPEKAAIAKGMGLNLHSELSSWLESIAYVRNIIAHHSRLWDRDMVKVPVQNLNNPLSNWLNNKLISVQSQKPFLIISTMVFLCNHIYPNHHIKHKLLALFHNYPEIPIFKMGFVNNWQNQPLWN